MWMVDRAAFESVDSYVVENVGIEPTKVCLQSNPAPLRIPPCSSGCVSLPDAGCRFSAVNATARAT